MVGFEQLPATYQHKVQEFRQTAWTVFGIHLALREPPRYASRAFDPNIDRALKYNIGCESLEQLFAVRDVIARGRLPSELSFSAGHVTQFDPSQAPTGCATAYGWHAMPYAPDGDPANIELVKEELAAQMLETWAEYAPNLTRENVLHCHIHTANDYSREVINMVDGDIFMGSFDAGQSLWSHFGYRTPIDGLYMVGSPTHPGGAITGGGGYIAAGLIAEDLGITPWWMPVDIRHALAALGDRASGDGEEAPADAHQQHGDVLA